MRRLLAVALAAAAVATPLAATPALARTCGGILDNACTGTVCPMDCFTRYCDVWIDPLHNRSTAQCLTLPIST